MAKQSQAKKNKMQGYNYENEISKSLGWIHVYHKRIFYHKLPDTHAVRSVITQIRQLFYALPEYHQRKFRWLLGVHKKMTFPKQPWDFWLTVDGVSVGFEVKATKNPNDIRLYSMLSDHQFAYATHLELYGKGKAYIGICDRSSPQNHQMTILTRKEAREVLIEEARRYERGISMGMPFAYVAGFSHLPLIKAENRRTWSGPGFTKWDLRPFIDDISNGVRTPEQASSSKSVRSLCSPDD